jgi:hypothetical protein
VDVEEGAKPGGPVGVHRESPDRALLDMDLKMEPVLIVQRGHDVSRQFQVK